MVPYVEWVVTTAAVNCLRPNYLVHAGAVAWGNCGMILPAASGRGKSSLVAKLVTDGWQYLSDEVAVIEREHGRLLPLAKSLRLHEGARSVLQSVHPRLAPASPHRALDSSPIWYLAPDPRWLPDAPPLLRVAVIPSFDVASPTELRPASPSEILSCILNQSFNLREHGANAVGDLVRYLGAVRCYTLSFNDLDEAALILRKVVSDD